MNSSEQKAQMSQNIQTGEKFYYDDEISLIEILSVLWKRKGFIIAFILLCTAFSVLYLFLYNGTTYKTSAVISLNFPGIESYTNPDQSRFDKSQIVSPSILSKVKFFDNAADASDAPSKRLMMGIEDVIPKKILEEMKKNPEKTYLTNRFLLSLTTGEVDSLSEKDRSRIVLSIIEAYKNDFLEKYVKNTEYTEIIPDTFLKNNDYIDVVDVLKLRIDNAFAILAKKIKTMGNFRSAENNLSFADLKGDFEILKTVELPRVNDIVENLNLTKDKNVLKIKLKQKIKNLDAETKKETGKAQVAQELLEKITKVSSNAKDNLSIQAGTSVDTTFIEKLRKEDNLSYLIKTILESKTRANALLIEKNKTIEIIRELENGHDKTVSKENIEYVETSLVSLIRNYNTLSAKLGELTRAALKIKYANAVKIEQNPVFETTKERNARLIIILSVIAALFIAVFAAFMIEYISNANNDKQQLKQNEIESPLPLGAQ